jgi:hypothetical protein
MGTSAAGRSQADQRAWSITAQMPMTGVSDEVDIAPRLRQRGRIGLVMALAYTLAGVLVVLGLVLGAGIVAGLWFAVSASRPELLEKRRGER